MKKSGRPTGPAFAFGQTRGRQTPQVATEDSWQTRTACRRGRSKTPQLLQKRGRCCGNPQVHQNRGQGAIEYLMTYGWMILLVVVIGGALYGLGIFDPATWSGGKRANGFASLQVKDWKLTPSGTGGATLVLGNRKGESMTLTAFHFNTTTSPVVGCTYGYPTAASVTLAENQEVTITSDSCNATGLTKGRQYTADVRIDFTSPGGITHSDSGTVSGKVE